MKIENILKEKLDDIRCVLERIEDKLSPRRIDISNEVMHSIVWAIALILAIAIICSTVIRIR